MFKLCPNLRFRTYSPPRSSPQLRTSHLQSVGGYVVNSRSTAKIETGKPRLMAGPRYLPALEIILHHHVEEDTGVYVSHSTDPCTGFNKKSIKLDVSGSKDFMVSTCAPPFETGRGPAEPEYNQKCERYHE